MTNNFTPKKSGTAARPQLSPEEYAAKKKAEKDAVYQMIDDTVLKSQIELLSKRVALNVKLSFNRLSRRC